MAGIIEYALLNAHKDFDTLPFSTVDGLILAQISYLHFDEIVPGLSTRKKGVRFSDISEHPAFNNIFTLPRTADKNKMLINALAYSKRYGQILVNYYQDIFDAKNDTQFSAVTFIINSDMAFIAFRGTDATITGWKENCNMLYTHPVASQILSVPYVEKVAKKFKGKLILSGHSKGGNLAIYASSMCSQAVKERIVEIQSFDNPGFTEEFINSEEYLATEPKIIKTVPEQSMVGMILSNRVNYRIIKSDGIGFFQHDPFMWNVEKDDFINGDKVDTMAKIIDGTFNEWVFGFKPEQRELFVETLFNIIESANNQNAATFGEWVEHLKGNAPLLIDAFKDLEPETRALMMKVFGNFFVSAKENVKTTQKHFIKSTFKKAKIKRIHII